MSVLAKLLAGQGTNAALEPNFLDANSFKSKYEVDVFPAAGTLLDFHNVNPIEQFGQF